MDGISGLGIYKIKEYYSPKIHETNKQVNILWILSLCPKKQGKSLRGVQTPFYFEEQDI